MNDIMYNVCTGCQVVPLTRNVGIQCDIMPATSTPDVTEDEDSNDTIITQNESDSRNDLSKSLFSSQDVGQCDISEPDYDAQFTTTEPDVLDDLPSQAISFE